jgi:hypothetical protein
MVVTLALGLGSAGCTWKMSIPHELDISPVEVREKIPLRAALYIRPDLRNATYFVHWLRMGQVDVALAGEALVQGFKRVMSDIFQLVAVVESTEVLSPMDYDVVVAPEPLQLICDWIACRTERFKGTTSC